MRLASLKQAYIYHALVLCVGPSLVILSGLLGADLFDGFTHDTSSFSGLLSFGMFLLIAVPVVVIILGILLAIDHHKQNKQWVWLPITTLVFSLIMFPLSIYLSTVLSNYSDCQLAHEDNPVKCGY